MAFENNNTELTKLIIEYANKNDILLSIKEANQYGKYPPFRTFFHNNVEMIKIINKLC